MGERSIGRLILLYDRGRSSGDGLAEVSGPSSGVGEGSVKETRWDRSEGCSSGSGMAVTVIVMDCRGAVGCDPVLGHPRGSGADEILLLWRRSSSACSVLTGDEDRSCFLFGLESPCSKRAIACDTGTLLGVVWFKSSKRRVI